VNPAWVRNDAGEYSGTVQDSILGNGFAEASLMQDRHSIGGILTETINNKNYTNALVATTEDGRGLVGAEAATVPPVGSSPCTFSVRAKYDPNTAVLSGTYTAAQGCSGDSGSFSLNEGCSFSRHGLTNGTPVLIGGVRVKPDHGITQC
jgi:hypothetical protein